ncbi:isochorismatase family protein [Vibrio sp. S11_S32]|uniref:isochorismatase family protein n=1 Tax=Vibrio sp. S11_S32 TaxID=2720225 RepID=UPI001680303A|nr:isochorismatase family protein [Vibrio sp. S11_S32]MBD1577661.1 isochorismatase family protein [Vibrio sp. S11_S32]
MSITTLDPKTALIVIDLQTGILALPTCHDTDPVVEKSCQLVTAFRDKNLPVVLVNVAAGAPGRTDQGASHGEFPADFIQLDARLNVQASDHLVTKKTWGGFVNTDLDQYLKAQGVTQVVIVGVATSIGVESTARQAWELGYNVTLATDAMTDLNLDTHNNSVNLIFPRMAETGSTQDVLTLIEQI